MTKLKFTFIYVSFLAIFTSCATKIGDVEPGFKSDYSPGTPLYVTALLTTDEAPAVHVVTKQDPITPISDASVLLSTDLYSSRFPSVPSDSSRLNFADSIGSYTSLHTFTGGQIITLYVQHPSLGYLSQSLLSPMPLHLSVDSVHWLTDSCVVRCRPKAYSGGYDDVCTISGLSGYHNCRTLPDSLTLTLPVEGDSAILRISSHTRGYQLYMESYERLMSSTILSEAVTLYSNLGDQNGIFTITTTTCKTIHHK